MVNKKRLFVTDLDGTLLAKDSTLKHELEIRINYLICQGEYITFITGRELVSAIHIMKGIKKTIPFAAYNGSVIYDPMKNKIVYYWELPKQALFHIINRLMINQLTHITYMNQDEIKKDRLSKEIIKKYPVISISLRDRKQEIEIIYQEIEEECKKYYLNIQKYPDPIDDTVFIIDITSSLGSKGNAIQYIARLLEIGLEDVIAFGNSRNDISMFQITGTPCCVGEGIQELLELAKEQLPYNEGDSVLEYIENVTSKDVKCTWNLQIPQKGWSYDEILAYIEPGKSSRSEGGSFMGYPQTTPHSIAIEAYEKYLPYNTNQIGVFSNPDHLGSKTRRMEYEILQMLGGLYGIINPDGYITSGGTEGNIVGIWIARNIFQKMKKEIVLLKTELTHSSISKAVNLLSIPELIVKTNDQFQMDVLDLKQKVSEFRQKNVGLIVVATLGYTNTGSCDDIFAISDVLQKMEQLYGINAYIHIDAAIGGMVYPFLKDIDNHFFQKNNVMSITIDPHKMGYIPFSCGVFLGRSKLLFQIEVDCSYSKRQKENTLLGSRNGAAAVACWSTLMYLGMIGYQSILASLIEKKMYLLQELEKETEIVSNPPSNMCTLRFIHFENCELPIQVQEKYAIHSFGLNVNHKQVNCYKIYIMPHITYDVINQFIGDIKKNRRSDYGI